MKYKKATEARAYSKTDLQGLACKLEYDKNNHLRYIVQNDHK